MNKIVLSLLLVFAFANGFSQKIVFQGIVLDSKGNPIPFATISLNKEPVGTITYGDGTFILNFEKVKSDSVVVYCLGYSRKIFNINEIKSDQSYTVRLVEKSFSINEVIVNSRKLRIKKVENKSKERNTYNGALGVIVVSKVDGIAGRKLRDVLFYIESQKLDAYVGFRLFKVDSKTGLPGEELLDTNVVLKVTKGDKSIKANVAGFNVVVPSEGVFVGLELLGNISQDRGEVCTTCNRVGPKIIMTTNVNRKNTFIGSWRHQWHCYSCEMVAGKFPNMKVGFTYYDIEE